MREGFFSGSIALWKHIYESELVDYVPINETERIEEYINVKGVEPFFDNK